MDRRILEPCMSTERSRGTTPPPPCIGGNNQLIWTRSVRGRPQTKIRKELEGMGHAPPGHWTENSAASKVLCSAACTGDFDGQIVLVLRMLYAYVPLNVGALRNTAWRRAGRVGDQDNLSPTGREGQEWQRVECRRKGLKFFEFENEEYAVQVR